MIVTRLLYYIVVIPMANLPLICSYGIGYLFYLTIYYLIPYRKKVVLRNITRSFPDHQKEKNKGLTKAFYKYFVQLLAEAVKNLVISEKNLMKRIKVRNPEIMEDFYQSGKSVLLLSSHYNNWEFLITAQNLLFSHQAVGIGTPLSDKFWDKKINQRRERFGMKVVHSGNYKEWIKDAKEPTATLILGDQSPGKDENCYWTRFLNQTTAFHFGAEILANEIDAAVVYVVIHHTDKKGYYELELKTITSEPRNESYGKITGDYIHLLEKNIQAKPERWLWSHKRWKKTIPKDLEELKKNHEDRFHERFRKETLV